MTTDLLVFGGTAPVPPSCRRRPLPLPAWTAAAGSTATIELPPLHPRAPANLILPSLSILTGCDYSFQFEARTGGRTGWTALSPVGPHGFPPRHDAEPDPDLTAEIDLYRVSPAAAAVWLRLRIHSRELDAVTRAPTLAAVSLSDSVGSPVLAPARRVSASPPGATGEDVSTRPVRLHVPSLSQMDAPEPIRHRICSPTAVAMVLAYWKRPAAPQDLATEVFDPRHDLYGVWPAAIRAAARRGIHGYLLRFPSWEAAAWCLDRGLPVVASVRYAAGELRGAAMEATRGHLLVLTGYEGRTVLANDPAAPSAASVPRRYALEDVTRVWLERAGVGYVLFDRALRADVRRRARPWRRA